jgi:dissimilatory sulfite reductase related protein
VVDEEGFLQQPEIWNEEVAQLFATTEGIEAMSPGHWAVVNYISEYWVQHGTAPLIRKITQTTGINLRTIYQLFTSSPAKGAGKIAGLPKPEGCV